MRLSLFIFVAILSVTAFLLPEKATAQIDDFAKSNQEYYDIHSRRIDHLEEYNRLFTHINERRNKHNVAMTDARNNFHEDWKNHDINMDYRNAIYQFGQQKDFQSTKPVKDNEIMNTILLHPPQE